jgi:nicotinamide-nucleotide amidase
MWLCKDGKHLVMLPGPPNELYPMFEEQVLPRLQSEGLIGTGQAYLQLCTCGVGESHLETLLQPVFDRAGELLQVAYCAHNGVVDVRLSSLDESRLSWSAVEKVGEECSGLLGDDLVCFGDHTMAQLVINQVRALGRKVAVAESCTGGLLANAFTDIPGASAVFSGGVVCYNNAAKVEMLGVPEAIINQHGVVSAECAAAMAAGVSERFSAEYSLSVTGIAGPGGGTCENPVGTVYLGYHSPAGVWSRRVNLPGGRVTVKARAVAAALDWMRRKLKESEVEDVLSSMIR